MLYNQLLHILRTLKKSLSCPKCQQRFQNQHIDVVDIYEDEGLFLAYCPSCDVAVEVTMTLQDEETLFSHNYIDEYSKQMSVTEDDIKGVAKRLESFKGNLKDLFS